MSSNGAFSGPARELFNDVKRHVQEQGRTIRVVVDQAATFPVPVVAAAGRTRQMATGGRARGRSLGRSPASVNHFPPKLGWPPRRDAPVVTCCRAVPALPAFLLDVSVCWQKP